MALNQLGLGFLFTAKDLASGVIGQIRGHFGQMDEASEKSGEATKKWAEGVRNAGLAVAAVSGAALAFLGYAAEKAHEFDRAINLVAQRVTEAEFPVEKMKGLAMELGQQFGKLPTEEADALFKAVGAGARDASSAQQLMTAANQLAKASNTDLQTSLGEVTEILKAYGLGFEHAGEAADALFIAANRGNTTVAELGNMLEHFAPAAARAGLSMQEMLAAISAMSSSGVEGRAAMAGLKAVLDSLIAPSKEAVAEAHRLGIAFSAAAVKAEGLPELLRQISESGRMNKDTLTKLFGSTEATTAALALMKNKGADLNVVLGEMAQGNGAAAAAAARMTTEGERFEALWGSALIQIGEAVKPFKELVLGAVNAILEVFNAIPKPIRTVVVGLVGLVAACGLLAGAAVAAAAGLFLMETPLLPLIAGLGAAVALTGALVVAFLAIAGPIAIALAGLKFAFDHNLGGIRDTITQLLEKARLVWDGLKQLFTDGGFSGAVRAELDKAENAGLKQFVITVFMWGSRIKAFFEGIGTGFKSAITAMGPTFEALSHAFALLGKAISNLFSGPNDPAGNAAKFDTFAGAGERVGAVLARIVEWAAKAATWVVEFTTDLVTGAKPLMPLFSAIGDGITAIFRNVGELGQSLNNLAGSFGSSGDSANAWATFLRNTVAGDLLVFQSLLHQTASALHVAAAGIDRVAAVWNHFRAQAASALEFVYNQVLKVAQVLDALAAKIGVNLGAAAAVQGAAEDAGGRAGKFLNGNVRASAAGAAQESPTTVPTAPEGAATAPGTNVAQAGAQGAGGGGIKERGGGGAEVAAAIQQGFASKAPDNVNIPVSLYLDGDKIADAVAARQGGNAARGFSPQAPPR